MRLYSGKIPTISQELERTLRADGDIEIENVEEVRLDFEAVLKEYLRVEREVIDEAKQRMEARKLGYSNLGRMRSQVARERGAPPADEILPYLVDQLLNMLFHSANVTEVFADDKDLRTKITPILRRHMQVEEELDREVRERIRNLEEGTASFEVEYAKVLEQMKRKRGLS